MGEFNLFLSENLTVIVILLIVSLIVGYLFGSIPFAYLYCKAHNVDILKFGSGNPGSTNVGRALGKSHGRLIFVLDILKVVMPVILLRFIFLYFYLKIDFKLYFYFMTTHKNIDGELLSNFISYDQFKFYRDFIAIYTGLGGIIGHNFPIFLNFKGGKGISCTMGAILSFYFVYAILLFLFYKLITKITKYVSVGSLSAVSLFFISSLIFIFTNKTPYHYISGVGYALLLIPGIFAMWFFAVLRHKENLIRLFNGTENKVKE